MRLLQARHAAALEQQGHQGQSHVHPGPHDDAQGGGHVGVPQPTRGAQWEPWIAALPRHVRTPLEYDSADIQRLGCSYMAEEIESMQGCMEACYEVRGRGTGRWAVGELQRAGGSNEILALALSVTSRQVTVRACWALAGGTGLHRQGRPTPCPTPQRTPSAARGSPPTRRSDTDTPGPLRPLPCAGWPRRRCVASWRPSDAAGRTSCGPCR